MNDCIFVLKLSQMPRHYSQSEMYCTVIVSDQLAMESYLVILDVIVGQCTYQKQLEEVFEASNDFQTFA